MNRFIRTSSSISGALAALAVIYVSALHTTAQPVSHGIVAANLEVVITNFDNAAGSVGITIPYKIGDFRLRGGTETNGANNGDYDIQIGDDPRDDIVSPGGGVLITSSREDGREHITVDGNGHILYPGMNWATTHAAYVDASPTNGWFIPVQMTWPNAINTSIVEYDLNVAAAWFPYSKFIAGYGHYSAPAAMNNQALDEFWGSPGLVFGTHFQDIGGTTMGTATYVVDLTSLGIDSRTDGILLSMGAKNDDNYTSQQAQTNGTWYIWSKDNGTTGGGERDPVEFVFIHKTNTAVISGRFLANGTAEMYSGDSQRFTVTPMEAGYWELKFQGLTPAHGVLIVTPEGGRTDNNDNIVGYKLNTAGDGFVVWARDLAGVQQADTSILCPLETPADGTEPIASFVFVLGATPGFTVTPDANLQTSESGATAAFTVVLNTEPTANVTLGITSSDTTEGTVSPSSLTFTPTDWATPQTVTVTGQNDALQDGPVDYSIVLAAAVSSDATYSGINPADLSAINSDNEIGITVSPAAGLITTEAGGAATFTVQLNTQPTANVTIGLSSSDTTEGTVSPASLTFTTANWNTKQTVTVTGVNDGLDDGDIVYNVVTAAATSTDANYNGQDALDAEVTNMDNDTAAIVVDPTTLSIREGLIGNFTVVLGSEPTANVVVTVASGDSVNGPASPSTLTFTPANWAAPQTVTVTAVDNFVALGDLFLNVANTAASSDATYGAIDPADVAVTLLDNEARLDVSVGIYGSEGGAVYGSGMPAILVAPVGTVLDPNVASYAGASFAAAVTANSSADDRLAIRSYGTGPDQIGVSGSTVTYANVPIGTFTGGSGSTPLTVTLNAAANPTNAQALMRAITFQNVNIAPSTAARTVTFSLTHADAGVATVTTTVRVGLLRLAEFQKGADRGYGLYTNAFDTTIGPGPEYRDAYLTGDIGLNTNYALWMDAPASGAIEGAQALLRFDEIVGTGLGQVPTNATIVYAELVLTMPPSIGNSPGDGSPLYRMLVPWNPDDLTWASAGNGDLTGFQVNDTHARSTYDSFLGLANGDASTGTGTIRLGVTPDLNAWVNGGEVNYGWLMPGWLPPAAAAPRTDGTAFASSEWTNSVSERPLLRVYWLPKDTAVASFRQGANGYTGAKDTRVRFNAPDADASVGNGVFVDWAVAATPAQNEDQPLLQFQDIIGSAAGQIPAFSRIDAAILDLSCSIGNAMGDGGHFHAMLKPWADTDTWNTLVDGVVADDVEAVAAPTALAGNASRDPNVQAAFLSFDLTADVQTWAVGTRQNYGWVILPWPSGGDGWGFGTAEQALEVNRPQLRVYYTPGAADVPASMQSPVVTPTSVQVRFNGKPNTTYSVERTGSLPGGWGPVGPVTTDVNGLGTYNDNAPLSSGAFYRVSSVQ